MLFAKHVPAYAKGVESVVNLKTPLASPKAPFATLKRYLEHVCTSFAKCLESVAILYTSFDHYEVPFVKSLTDLFEKN